MVTHHWQCGWHLDGYNFECDCGVTGPRRAVMDQLPADRAPTMDELRAHWDAQAKREAEMGAAHEPVEEGV